jgi:hypothetical protein
MTITVVERERGLPSSDLKYTTAGRLRAIGHDAELVADGSDAIADASHLLIAGAAQWFPNTWPLLRRLARRPRTLFWQTEPLPMPTSAGVRLAPLHAPELAKVVLRDSRRSDPRSNARGLQRVLRHGLVDAVAVSTYERKLFLAEQGVDAAFVPLGYHPLLYGEDRGLARDIDVLFVGALDVPRRRRILRQLRAGGVAVQALGDWTDKGLWGEERTQVLNRTKILLNLPRHPGMLSGGRMLLGMANRAQIVAEPIFEPRPYVPGKHYVSSPIDQLAAAVQRSLEHDAEREAMTEAAYELVTTELAMERCHAKLVELFG